MRDIAEFYKTKDKMVECRLKSAIKITSVNSFLSPMERSYFTGRLELWRGIFRMTSKQLVIILRTIT